MAIPTDARDNVFLIQSQIIRVLCISAQRDHSENLQSMLLFISYLNGITSLIVNEQYTENNGKYHQVKKIQQRMHVTWNNCSHYCADVITCSLQTGLCVYRGCDVRSMFSLGPLIQPRVDAGNVL